MSDDEAPYVYFNSRLPRGLSHLIKRSDLDGQLAGIDPCPIVHVSRSSGRFRRQEPDGLWLCEISWRAREQVHLRMLRGAHVTFYPVPSQLRAELRTLATERIVPASIAWAREVGAGPETRRDLQPKVSWLFVDGELIRRDHG